MNDKITWSAQGIVDAAPFEQWDKERWYAGDLGKCPRGLMYARQGKKPTNPPDARSRRIMRMGTKMEDMIVEDFERYLLPMLESGKIQEIDTQRYFIDKERGVSGRSDIFVVSGTKDLPHILYEIKSVSSKSFWWMAKEGWVVRPEHGLQTHWYLNRILIEDGIKPIGVEARVLYVSRDDLVVQELPVPYSKTTAEQSNKFFDYLNTCMKKGNLPVASPAITENPINGLWQVNFRAKFCSFHALCMNDIEWELKAEADAKAKNKGRVSYTKKTKTKQTKEVTKKKVTKKKLIKRNN